MPAAQRVSRLDDHRPVAALAVDVAAGLAATPKRLPSKYFYDARGSALFERICEQPEYYPTRTEIAIMRANVDAIADTLGPEVRLVEYGSGSGLKTRLLLDNLAPRVVYVPVEISRSALADSAARLAREFPEVELRPICADFTRPLRLPEAGPRQRRTAVYFPGSTLGNFPADAALQLLRQMREEAGPGGGVLIGIDLVKHPAVLEAAYNDAAGATAEFTLNLLVRLNREAEADFDLAGFRHRAHWNPMAERIETFIVSQRRQDVCLGGCKYRFGCGEAMLVEYSCKYTPDSFARLAARAGLRVAHVWTDPARWFSLQWLVPA